MKKIWIVSYEPTKEKFYFLNKKMALETIKNLKKFDEEVYGEEPQTKLEESFIQEKALIT